MQLVRWQFQNLDIPMMADDNGTLYTTGPVLALALGLSENTLHSMYHYHKDEFDGLSLHAVNAKEFLQANKEAFKISRLRKDLHLWTESDMITFAVYAQSERGKQFRKEVVDLVKQQARKSYVSRQEWDQLVTNYGVLYGQFEILKQKIEELEEAKPALRSTASAAGAALSAQRFTKNLRN